ncbi:Uncharacterised protein [Mycobacteroides abscessus subsp. abscessus]|nr:Uncharacterised protein [Mycobacteroides abscessus subsp. abscessus]
MVFKRNLAGASRIFLHIRIQNLFYHLFNRFSHASDIFLDLRNPGLTLDPNGRFSN